MCIHMEIHSTVCPTFSSLWKKDVFKQISETMMQHRHPVTRREAAQGPPRNICRGDKYMRPNTCTDTTVFAECCCCVSTCVFSYLCTSEHIMDIHGSLKLHHSCTLIQPVHAKRNTRGVSRAISMLDSDKCVVCVL